MDMISIWIMFSVVFEISFSKQFPRKRIRKRQMSAKTEYIIELLLVADFSVYTYFMDKANERAEINSSYITDGELMLKRHFHVLLHEIDRRYKMVKDQAFSVRIANAGLHVIKSLDDSIWIPTNYTGYTLDASRTLSYFRRWEREMYMLPVHDHAMLFTRYDLIKDGSDSVAGLAYVESLCSQRSFSIVEDGESISAITVAVHELAHSLGAQHDGTYNECSSTDNYIMSDTARVNKNINRNRNSWRFSPCSITYFKRYITKITREGRNCINSVEGANITSPFLDEFNVFSNDTHPDQQCRNIDGETSFLCRKFYEHDYTSLCGLMYCYSGGNVCNYRLPVDGTRCGNQTVCIAGYCVKSEHAPVLSDTCPFGDQPGALSVSGSSCSDAVSGQPYICYQEYYSSRCCQSCESIHTGIEGCEYGDRLASCAYIGRVNCLFNSKDCCATCAYYRETMTELIIPVSAIGGSVVLTCVIILVLCIRRRNRNKVKDTIPPSQARDHRRNEQAQRKPRAVTTRDCQVPNFNQDRVTGLPDLRTYCNRGQAYLPSRLDNAFEQLNIYDLCHFHNIREPRTRNTLQDN